MRPHLAGAVGRSPARQFILTSKKRFRYSIFSYCCLATSAFLLDLPTTARHSRSKITKTKTAVTTNSASLFSAQKQSLSALQMSTEPSTCSNKNVVVVGSANTDVTSYAPRMPLPGETIIGNEFTSSCGGKGANQAVAAALLDIPGVDVSMICKVGRDQFGDLLLKNFKRAGVLFDEDAVFVDDGVTTGVATILVDDRSGENCIVVVPGANGKLSPGDVSQAFDSLVQKQMAPDVVVCQLEIKLKSALEAFRCAKKLNPNCITILNPAPAPSGNTEFEQLSEEFYALTDILVPNEIELQLLCNDNCTDEIKLARKILGNGVNKAVVVTLGARGAIIVEKSGKVTQVEIPDLPCSSLPVRDTVGAGDAFCGALASYLSADIDLAEAARRSCGVASMSVRKQGAQSSYPINGDLPIEFQVPGPKVEKIAKVPQITFVTGNKKKLEEVQRMLVTSGKIPFSITNRKIDLPELQGDPRDIAVEKCKLAAAEVKGPVMTEDTSLCFNALNGLVSFYRRNCNSASTSFTMKCFSHCYFLPVSTKSRVLT